MSWNGWQGRAGRRLRAALAAAMLPVVAATVHPPAPAAAQEPPPVEPPRFQQAAAIDPGPGVVELGPVVLADLDGDGALDVALGGQLRRTAEGGFLDHRPFVSVAAGSGDGGFAPADQHLLGVENDIRAVIDLAAVDVDGDGDLDLVAVLHGEVNASRKSDAFEELAVLVNDGAGGFGATTVVPLPAPVIMVRTGDLDGDGDEDLVVAGENGMVVLRNDGTGAFEAGPQYPGRVQDLAVGDVDGDGAADLVHSRDFASALAVRLNDGDGGFDALASFEHRLYDFAVFPGDWDGDGDLDVAVAGTPWDTGGATCGAATCIGVLRNDGTGTFSDAPTYAPADLRMRHTVEHGTFDLDGDGRRDLALAGERGVATAFGADGLDFEAAEWLIDVPGVAAVDPVATAVGDLDGDGVLDVVATSWSPSSPPVVAVLLGRADEPRTFDAPRLWPLADTSVHAGHVRTFAPGEVTGDDAPDLVAVAAGRATTVAGDGGGRFGPPVTTPVGFCAGATAEVVTADFDGDGVDDVACAGNPSGVAYGVGDGTFADPVVFPPTTEGSADLTGRGAAAGDLDGDGRPDLVLVTQPHGPGASVSKLEVRLALPDGRGFDDPVVVDLGAVTRTAVAGVGLADFDGDGHLDVAAVGGGGVRAFPGNGDGTFGEPSATGAFSFAHRVVAADVDLDGVPDLVVADGAPHVSVLQGIGNGAFHPPAEQATPGDVDDVAVADLNGDGVPDLLAVEGHGRASVLPGAGYPVYAPAVEVTATGFLAGAHVADLDGDGAADLALGHAPVDHDFGADEPDRVAVFLGAAGGGPIGELPNLVPSGLDGPEVGTAGEQVTVRWRETNAGDVPATGPWSTRLTLEPVGDGFAEPVLVGDLALVGAATLAPGEHVDLEATVTMPAGVLGRDYRWQVRTNVGAQVFEGAGFADNVLAADHATSVVVPRLPWNGPLDVELAAGDGRRWFVTSGTDLRSLRLAVDADDAATTRVYTRHGAIPTPTAYDHRSDPGGGADHVVLVPPGPSPQVYVLVERVAGPGPTAVRVEAGQLVTTELAAVEPSVSGRQGTTTFRVSGDDLTAAIEVHLAAGAERHEAVAVVPGEDRSSLYATFDMTAVPAGTYAVEVDSVGFHAEEPRLEITTARLDTAVTVDDGEGGRLDHTLAGPRFARRNGPFTAHLTWRNDGDNDLAVPLLVVSGANRLALVGDPAPSPPLGNVLQFLGLPSTGPAAVLRPGQSETVTISGRAPTVATATLRAAAAGDGPGPDVGTLLAVAGIGDDHLGSGTAAAVAAAVGPTWATYRAALAAEAGPAASRSRLASHLLGQLVARVAAAAGDDAGPEPLVAPVAAKAGPGASSAKDDGGGDGRPDPIEGVVHPDPPDATAQSFFGEGDKRNWHQPTAQRYYSWLYSASAFASGNPFGSSHDISTKVMSDHLDHWLHGDGSLRHYESSHPFAMLLGSDAGFVEYLEGPKVKETLTPLVRQLAEGLECSEGVNSAGHELTIHEASGGIGLTWSADNLSATYGIGKVATMNLTIADITVFRTAGGEIVYYGTTFVDIEDSYRWKYPPPDEYQHWDDFNFWAWYLEHYGISMPFPITADLGGHDFAGSLPSTPCPGTPEEEPEPPEDDETPPEEVEIELVGSMDPNDKASSGVGAGGYVRRGDTVHYTVRFENIETATAAAQLVTIEDELDPRIDRATVELGAVGFGDTTVPVPAGRQDFEALVPSGVDAYPVRIVAGLDPVSGLLSWSFASEDPATLGPPADPFAGFLPPNDDTGVGEGFVTFSARLVDGLAEGEAVPNDAEIVFDVNEPIVTNDAPAAIDDHPPASAADSAVQGDGTDVEVTWAGSDGPGSGVESYDVFVSVDGGPLEPWLAGTAETAGTFDGEAGRTYGFATRAVDRVGFREAAPTEADVEVEVVDPGDVDPPTPPPPAGGGGGGGGGGGSGHHRDLHEARGTMGAGEPLSTVAGPDGATEGNPIVTEVRTERAGEVTIDEGGAGPVPDGWSALGAHAAITAPGGGDGDPLRLTFLLDGSLLPPGEDVGTVTVFRDGTPVTACEEPGALGPDPCVTERGADGGDPRIVVLTSEASTWSFGTPAPGSLAAACPAGTPAAGFADVDGANVHRQAVGCAAALGLTTGVAADRFDPAGTVSRAQMAAFVDRLLTAAGIVLPAGPDAFGDDDGSVHEAAIDRLAAAGIVNGVGGGRFAPERPVTRAEVATLAAGAYARIAERAASGPDAFGDDDGSVHESAIDALALLGVVTGTADGGYRPGDDLRRDQLASILARLAGRLAAEGHLPTSARSREEGGQPRPPARPVTCLLPSC